jgi:hypothetical protein
MPSSLYFFKRQVESVRCGVSPHWLSRKLRGFHAVVANSSAGVNTIQLGHHDVSSWYDLESERGIIFFQFR